MSINPCCTITTASSLVTLPSLAALEAKEKRKAVLERAAATMKANYRRFMQKQRAINNRDAGEGEI